MSEYTRHHFVPQFCLREFATDANRRRIGTYLIQKRLYVPSTSIRAQAQRAKLYGSDEREKILSGIEGAAAAVIQRMVNTLKVPTRYSEDHATLLVHVLFQSTRTPTAAAELEEQMNQMMKTIVAHDEVVAPHLNVLRLRLHNGAVQSLAVAKDAIPLTLDLHYKLLNNESNIPFIISDHPVAKYNQFMERRSVEFGCTGFGSRGVQLFLPISPRVTLMLYDCDVYRVGRTGGSNVVTVDNDDVDGLNLLQIVNAGSQLFFSAHATQDMLQRLWKRSQKWVPRERSAVKEFPQPPKRPGTQRSIIVTSLSDIRIGLKLSNVVELPSAQKYKVTDGMSLVRDPRMYELRYDFDSRVSAGLYGRMDFDRYLDDVATGSIRQFFQVL